MTQGAIIFAFGNDINYLKIAQAAAKRAEHFLGIPVSIITDRDMSMPRGSTRHWQDSGKTTAWFNGSRCKAYELSPYDVTLLIDADFWIATDNLKKVLDSDQPFLCHRRYMNLPRPGHVETGHMGTLKTDMWWATVIKFDRSQYSRDIFECWHMIEQHYHHYANLFGFSQKPFRNDFALSLALLMVNGHQQPIDIDIPWPLVNVLPEAQVKWTDDKWEISYQRLVEKEIKPYKILVKDQDLHFMGKSYLELYHDLPI